MENVIEYEGKIYRQLTRKANVGDLIFIMDAWDAHGKYENGDVFKVPKVCYGGVEIPEVSAECNASGYITNSEYVVLNLIGDMPEITPEPSPQLAGIHDALASMAQKINVIQKYLGFNKMGAGRVVELDTKVSDLKFEVKQLTDKLEEQSQEIDSIYEELNGKISHLEADVEMELTPLQLAILNAKDTPAETKLTMIVEAGRLESERQAKLDA